MTAITPGSKHDKILGMMYGVALGDALGAPHEFRKQIGLDKYTGILEHPILRHRMFKGTFKYPPGTITDDTEMSLALAWSIMASTGYNRDKAAKEYIAWANSGAWAMGRNTRQLFQGVSTLAGYEKRRALKLGEHIDLQSQSNGFLMRACPLAVLPNWEEAAAADCALTNFPPVCIDVSRVYVGALHDALEGHDRAKIFERACERAQTQEVTDVLMQVADEQDRDIGAPHSGWCLHALYTAFYALNEYRGSYQDTVDLVIRLGGDTDTNGAIAGGLIGAFVGSYLMTREERTIKNINIIMGIGVDKPEPQYASLDRPNGYRAYQIPKIASSLASLSTVLEKRARANTTMPQDGGPAKK
jgi:ADP-ribosyl-[dinitrogen reductase] hydrolase